MQRAIFPDDNTAYTVMSIRMVSKPRQAVLERNLSMCRFKVGDVPWKELAHSSVTPCRKLTHESVVLKHSVPRLYIAPLYGGQ